MQIKINYVGVSFVSTPTFKPILLLIALYTKQLSKRRKMLNLNNIYLYENRNKKNETI